ncbi:MAG: hypothetical protein COC19_07470 [SAR86 cluster bacterium]|uniref:Thiol:disulfide interchange protein DsbD N-terminal domain-containing protein n=1 Tax=SAR86 cluster bacterium TaxID=2030880 RepID=A0A2A4MHT3_9GAMM|nr:MAG: hypothetical protein COC19_07470 [SAR86 cluster bacterium]
MFQTAVVTTQMLKQAQQAGSKKWQHTLLPFLLLLLFFSLNSTQALAQSLGGNTTTFSSTSSLTQNRPAPLAQDVAFPFYVSIDSAQQLSISWTIAPGHYLYRHQFHFALKHSTPNTSSNSSSNSSTDLAFIIPDGLKKNDEFFGDIEAYYQQVKATLTLPRESQTGDTLIIQFQGCADWGFCYPPQNRVIDLHQ